jgi:hypothetical protein
MCHTTEETQDHFTTCTDTRSTLSWKQATLAIRHKANKLAIDPVLIRLIIYALTEWRLQQELIVPAFLPQTYLLLFQQQSKIGWNQIMKGRLTHRWVYHQDMYAPNNQGLTKLSLLVTTIYTEIYKIWKNRCDIQHGKTQADIDDKTKYQIEPRVQALYATRTRLNYLDQLQFDTPIAEIMALPVNHLEHWLQRTTKIVKASLKRARHQDQLQMRPLQFYFPTQTRTTPSTHETNPQPTKPPSYTTTFNVSNAMQHTSDSLNITPQFHYITHQKIQNHPSAYKPP